MSVLVKGMEMPNRCADCPMCYDYMLCRLEGNYFGKLDCIELRADWCPLIELPPHGRLIDADALRLLYDFKGYTPTGDMTEEEFDKLMCRLPVIRQNIDDAPTIIEAEVDDDNSK